MVQELLGHLLVCGSRFALGSLFVPYGQGLRQTLREARELATRCTHDFSRRSRGTVSVTLYRMKKQKLVSASGPHKRTIWKITQKGKGYFKDAKNDFDLLPEDGKTRVVMFDIPEDRRGERNWLRTELLSCNYSPLQKSVFVGKRPLPTELLKKIRERKLVANIHVVGLEGKF